MKDESTIMLLSSGLDFMFLLRIKDTFCLLICVQLIELPPIYIDITILAYSQDRNKRDSFSTEF